MNPASCFININPVSLTGNARTNMSSMSPNTCNGSTARQAVNAWKARAFRKSVVASEIHSGTTEESAILAVKTQLDKDRAHQIALRGPDGFPTAKEVGQALDMIWDEITAEQRLMLLAHFHEPDHIMTANQLAQAGLYESFPSANSQYGVLRRRLGGKP